MRIPRKNTPIAAIVVIIMAIALTLFGNEPRNHQEHNDSPYSVVNSNVP